MPGGARDKPIMSGDLAIIWHSRTGAAKAMAESLCSGAGARAVLIPAERATPNLLGHAAGFVFVCPENLGSMSGPMKDMFDRCYYPLLGQVEGRGYATVIAAGSDGKGAEAQIDRIVTGWRMKRIAPPLIANLQAQTAEAILSAKTVAVSTLDKCKDLGLSLTEGVRMGIY